MKLLRREASAYALLLVLLFAIAAIAVWETLSYLSRLNLDPDDLTVITVLICVITFGLMFIGGAFALWAVRFAAREEGRRRVSRMVETMDYIQDGLLAVDNKGRISGANPAVTRMAPGFAPQSLLTELFPELGPEEAEAIVTSRSPQEATIERAGGITLRLRSQPSEGLSLILVSDITESDTRRRRSRQMARLQLLGEIARGVAYDFSNLMCAISGYNSLLSRFPYDSPQWRQSRDAVGRYIERGTALAGRLLGLSAATSGGRGQTVSDAIGAATDMLTQILRPDWKIESQVSPSTAEVVPRLNLEQLIVNLGILAADQAVTPGVLSVISAGREEGGVFDGGARFGGSIVIATVPVAEVGSQSLIRRATSDSGVVLSLVRSMIEDSEGALDYFTARDGVAVFRVCLAQGNENADENRMFGREIEPYLHGWNVLLAAPVRQHAALESRLVGLQVHVKRVGGISAVFSRLDSPDPLDCIVIDLSILSPEPLPLLRTMLKLAPRLAVVVSGTPGTQEIAQLGGEVVFIGPSSTSDEVVRALVEAKALAMKRIHA